ncbi:MAG: ferric reductase-like transmembrane domain-containing protein [Candidatus Micrarchaeota archaeon]
MDKPSFLFLLIMAGTASIFAYEAFWPVFIPSSGFMLPPSTGFVDALALSAFFILCVSLLIGPVAVLWPKAGVPLLGSRRAVGLAAFVFSLLHAILAIGLLYGFNPGILFGNFSLMAGAAALLVLLGLALTSSDWATKALGARNWKLVQYLNYLAFLLVFVHFIGIGKGIPGPQGIPKNISVTAVLMLLLGILAILLQAAGFLLRASRKADAPAPASTRAPAAVPASSAAPSDEKKEQV